MAAIMHSSFSTLNVISLPANSLGFWFQVRQRPALRMSETLTSILDEYTAFGDGRVSTTSAAMRW
ncbi:hypothetical protein QTI24_00050 [Variovorax sp. J22P240]|uniref:hypothetical protein n=1 Tax=Variovorax sp. J22P240 TaxID=3053514 RepID=UPI00257911F1|nr:hypothetical protein [Variovorax sp. J22P240]MDL9996973.1 hypothetical protein [Variovorax sp. J22P240]